MNNLDIYLYDYPSEIMNTSCKRFSGGKVRKHGSIRINGVHWYSHRYAWYLAKGYVPKQLNHLCEHSDCANVDHLYEGSQKQNVHDMYLKLEGKSTALYFKCGHGKWKNNRYIVRYSKLTKLPIFACITCKNINNLKRNYSEVH